MHRNPRVESAPGDPGLRHLLPECHLSPTGKADIPSVSVTLAATSRAPGHHNLLHIAPVMPQIPPVEIHSLTMYPSIPLKWRGCWEMSFIAGVNPALRSEVSQQIRRLLLLQLLPPHLRAGFILLESGLGKLRRQKAEPWPGPAFHPPLPHPPPCPSPHPCLLPRPHPEGLSQLREA